VTGAPEPTEKWVRYLKTSALTKVLDSVDPAAVMDMTATRSLQTEATDDTTLPYVHFVDRRVRSLRVEYNRVRHGPYDKDGVQKSLDDTLGEAVIQDLDLLFPPAFSKLVGETRKDNPDAQAEFASHQYVGHFAHYPCARDGEKNAFWEDVDLYMDPEEKTWMERASLDFIHFVPAEVFRDMSAKKNRVGGDYGEQIKKWQEVVGTNPPLLRAGMEMLFPDDDIRNRRFYRWKPHQKWILESVGEV
jgi:hypothetical protein